MENRINNDLLNPSFRNTGRPVEELAALGAELGGITRDTGRGGQCLVRINAGVLYSAGCWVLAPLVTKAGGRLSRGMDTVTIPHDYRDGDGRHAAAAFMFRLLDETAAEKARERGDERAAA